METFEHLKLNPIVAIIRRIPKEHTPLVIDALYVGGVRCVEITADSEGVFDIVQATKERYPNMKVGVGTVLTIEDAHKSIAHGADFILSPVVNKDVIRAVVSKGCVMIPGAFSPTEAYDAYIMGAQIIKMFPAGLLGPSFLKDMAGPLPFIPLAPTGGVSEKNIAEYIKLGAHCCGISSAIPTKFEVIDDEAKQIITEKAKLLTTIASEAQEVN